MTALDFLTASFCAPGTTTSPLRRALDGADPAVVRDLWPDGKVEVRGDLLERSARASDRFLVTDDDPADAVERLRAAGVLAYDATGALAGLAVEGEQLMRRLTDLDLDRLPAAGPFSRVTAIVVREEGERFGHGLDGLRDRLHGGLHTLGERIGDRPDRFDDWVGRRLHGLVDRGSGAVGNGIQR